MKHSPSLEMSMEVERLLGMLKRKEDRRFLAQPEPPTGFSDLPTSRTQDGITVEDRPEQEYRFIAYRKGAGARGYGKCESEAVEDLIRMEDEYMAAKLDRAEHGESKWWET